MLAGLAEVYPMVQQTFGEASDALGYDLWQLVSYNFVYCMLYEVITDVRVVRGPFEAAGAAQGAPRARQSRLGGVWVQPQSDHQRSGVRGAADGNVAAAGVV